MLIFAQHTPNPPFFPKRPHEAAKLPSFSIYFQAEALSLLLQTVRDRMGLGTIKPFLPASQPHIRKEAHRDKEVFFTFTEIELYVRVYAF